MKNTAPRGKI